MFAKTVRRLIAWWHLQMIAFGHHCNHTSSCAQITFQCTRPLFLSLYSTLWPLTTTPGPSTSCWPSDLEMFHFLLLRLMYFGHFFPNCILFVWRDPVQRNGWMELCFDMMPKYEDMRIDRWCTLLNDMLCMNRSQIYQLLCFTNQKGPKTKWVQLI